MSIYKYKLASEYVKIFVICLDLLFNFVPNLQFILYFRVFGGSQCDAGVS